MIAYKPQWQKRCNIEKATSLRILCTVLCYNIQLNWHHCITWLSKNHPCGLAQIYWIFNCLDHLCSLTNHRICHNHPSSIWVPDDKCVSLPHSTQEKGGSTSWIEKRTVMLLWKTTKVEVSPKLIVVGFWQICEQL